MLLPPEPPQPLSRNPPRATKPKIRKLRNTDLWVCRGGGSKVPGYGTAPEMAYKNWEQFLAC